MSQWKLSLTDEGIAADRAEQFPYDNQLFFLLG